MCILKNSLILRRESQILDPKAFLGRREKNKAPGNCLLLLKDVNSLLHC